MTENERTAELAMPAAFDAEGFDSSAPAQTVSPIVMILSMLRGRYHWALGLGITLAAIGGVAGYKLPKPLYRSVGLIDIAAKVPKVLSETDEKGLLPMFDAYVASQAQLAATRRVVDLAMSSPEWRTVGPAGSDEAVGAFLAGLQVSHPKYTQLVEIAYVHEDPNVAAVAVNQVIKAYMKIVTEKENAGGLSTVGVLENQLTVINRKLNDLRADVLAVTEDLGEAALTAKCENLTLERNRLDTVLHDLDLAIATAKAAGDISASGGGHVLTEREIALKDPGMDGLLQRRTEAQFRVETLKSHGGLGAKNPELIQAEEAVALLDRQIEERAVSFRAQLASSPDVRAATLRENEAKLHLIVELRDRIQEELRVLGKKGLALQNIKAEQLLQQDQLAQVRKRLEQITVESEGRERITVMSYGDRPVEPDTDRRVPFALMSAAIGMVLGFGIVLLWGLRESKLRHVVDVGGAASGRGRFLGVIPEVPEHPPGDGAHADSGEPGADAGADPAVLSDYCVHHIRTMLQLRSPDHRTVVALTSPSPGAGKTTLGLALGMSFATSGSRTLLIDCDFVGHGLSTAMCSMVCDAASRALAAPAGEASPPVAAKNGVRPGLMVGLLASRRISFNDAQVQELLGAVRERGRSGDAKAARTARVLEALVREPVNGKNGHASKRGILGALDGRPLAECVIETECPNLSVLPVGDAVERDAERLSRASLEQLIDACRESFDTVIIDTGPVLGSIEAAFATTAADSVLLVVARGERRPPVDDALGRIEGFGAEVSGVVFNRATSSDVARTSYSSRGHSRAAVAE